MACSTCHRQALAFTDGRPTAIGATGEIHPRNSLTLTNVAYMPVLTWANPNLSRIETQVLIPLFGEHPVEMGLAGHEADMLAMLNADPQYPDLFAAAFPDEVDAISLATTTRGLAAFVRSLVSANSPYDLYRYGGQTNAISDAAKRGEALFFSEQLECAHCHGGLNFSDSIADQRLPQPEIAFHNTALYNLDGQGAYPAGNTGLREVTGKTEDMGRFRTPTLRNVAVTSPYMHDGSVGTLDDVLTHYAAGGRTIPDGPHAGVGRTSPLKDRFVTGFVLGAQQRADLLAFLESLTDQQFLSDPRFGDPFAAPAGQN